MNINENASRGQIGGLLGDNSRKDEVKRLAQGVAAEYFGAGQAQQPQNGNSAYVDSARISDEAIQEISRSGKAGEIERTDQLVNALREAYATKAPEAAQQGAQQGQGGNGPEGPEAVDGASPGKKMEKKRTVMWEPSIEAGQVHPEGREVIGKITIKEDVKEVDAPGNSAKNSGGGTGGQAAGGAAASSAPTSSSPNTGNSSGAPSSVVGAVGKGQSSGNSAAQGNKEAQKKMDEEGEADKGTAQAAANMKSAGVAPPPELEQGAGNYEKGEKSKEMEVRTAATGATQTVSVTPAGEMSQGGTLRYFKKLDDKPMLKEVSLHSKGETFDRTADRYAMEAMNRGESPDQVVQQTEQLKKTTPDQ